jgi:two-component system, chemotaxis family, protein-glutamate methylesterase/glutaminase
VIRVKPGVMSTKKIVVIGGSAGGVETALQLTRDLPKDLNAAVFIVIHLSPSAPSLFAELLNKKSGIPVNWAVDGERIEAGHAYVARPDMHLIIDDEHICLGHGPRENGHRPAIDPLFRTAAHAHGENVIGVVLSGNLDDGGLGLREIRKMGGKAVVQDPKDSLYPGMPTNAIAEAGADVIVPVSGLGAAITQLVNAATSGNGNGAGMPDDIAAGGEGPMSIDERRDGKTSAFGCPECGGALWVVEEEEENVLRYRCRVGHAFSDESLLGSQAEGIERAMWAALRALEEGADQAHRLAQRMRTRGHASLYERFLAQALDYEERGKLIRRVLLRPDEAVSKAGD